MRLIDAEELERDGWHLCRIVHEDRNTVEYQTKKPTAFKALEVVRCKDCIAKDSCNLFGFDDMDFCSGGRRKDETD